VATAERCCSDWQKPSASDARSPCYLRVVRDELADADLVQRIAAGGEDAARAEETLCRRFAPRIRLYGLRHLRDEDRARDLVQTVLLGVIEACRQGRVEEADKIDRYVLGTCRHAAVRMREADARARPDDAIDDLAGMDGEGALEPIDKRTLARCLSELDRRAARVLVLSFQEERSAEEIAEQLAIAPGNVRVVRHRALAALRRCFDQRAEAVS
jgi:RNA polymerase sigma-70 factor, ECF subfamily